VKSGVETKHLLKKYLQTMNGKIIDERKGERK
jgi:hypothetical protein